MTARLLLPAALLLGLTASARAYEEMKPKPGARPAAEGRPPSNLDERLAGVEKQLGALLKEVQGLRQEVRTRGAAGGRSDEMRVFALKHASAAETAKMLQGLLQGKDGQQLRIVADERTNQVLVTGRSDVMDAIEAIISRLDAPGGKRNETPPEPKLEKPATTGPGAKLDDIKAGLRRFQLDMDNDRLQWLERMRQKGYLGQGQVDDELKNVREAMDLLKKARDVYRRATEEEKKPAKEEALPKK